MNLKSYSKNNVGARCNVPLQRYPKYKDSGIEWLGEIPEGWEVKRLKYVAYAEMGQSPDSGFYNKDGEGVPFLQGNADFKEIYPQPQVWTTEGNKYSKKNNILISVRAPVGEINISDGRYAIGRGLAAIRFSEKFCFRYYYYLFIVAKNYFDSISTGTTYSAISVDDVKNIAFTVPLLKEQTAIAAFLDHKTARIDELIKKNEKLIELLKEKRQAVISHAVTKGLDPNAKMKDSGIEWLGEIPSHWKVSKLKFLASIKLSGVDKKTLDGELPVKLWNYIDVYKNEFISEEVDFMEVSATKNEIVQLTINRGDVLITKDSETPDDIAVPAYVKSEFKNVLCGYHLARIRANAKYAVGGYLFRLFCAQNIREQFTPLANGITRYGLGKYSIDNSIFPVPTIDEQKMISTHIDHKTARIDKAITKIQSQIATLKEYRQALISNVVTGKVRVL